ncbi:phage tail sheath subtilisin-like domain-containing protein [Iningainema tapete]|uniref:Phage tail sheath subtilisin-like domain-containing protein n=1 Tax=Iningainema tapete BLCC-T55 TaxID=2748662 RepID=A0A8J7C5R1_9CYAN|nr:phage tail sheath subtilisin-like domain-containing protein [Iningainema tapete]MBD2773384.1 phage tail sheath subtilisin-like domain-containing protein [Iningainema tapete BLCC-T55]
MPITPTYPGVYIEEIPSGVRTITGVATSITAFIGRALRGPTDDPITINSYGDFERIFGGLWVESTLGYAVRDFFLNGGSQAIIVRLYHAKKDTQTKTKLSIDAIKLEAAYEGKWGMNLRAIIDTDVSEDVAARMGLKKTDLFNLTIQDASPGGFTERFLNISVENSSPRRIDKVLEAESQLMRWEDKWPATVPTLPKIAAAHEAHKKLAEEQKKLADLQSANPPDSAAIDAAKKAVENAYKALVDAQNELQDPVTKAEKHLEFLKNAIPQDSAAIDTAKKALADAKKAIADAVSDGEWLTQNDDFTPPQAEANKKGLYALEKVDLFNLLCIPPYLATNDVDVNLISKAATYCEKRRAMLIVDPPSNWKDKATAKEKFTDPNKDNVGTTSKNAALFFPRLKQPNPLRDNQMEEFAPCGAVAGIFARTDAQRGVWKAPAGLEATLVGVPQLSVALNDAENGELNPLGINCLRTFPAVGRVVWGARTLQGNDRLASEWKYIPVRRLALYIEESLYRGTQWVVFEPNDEPLWSQIRLNLGAFMQNLFRQGAFQGKTPQEAYFVKCDKETTTQNDINLGIVNIVVGFAPLKPAEFVFIKLQQMAGQIVV